MQQDSSEESLLEEQFHRDINAQADEYERQYTQHRENSLGAVWGAFQDSATAVAHLYRERTSNTYPDTGALWLPFQTAAGTVATLYTESCTGIKRSNELAFQSGYQRRTRELAEWARNKKRRMIRREDLLAYLAGKPLSSLSASHTNRRSPKPELSHGSNCNNIGTLSQSLPHHLSPSLPSSHTSEPTNDLHTFKEALVLRPRGPELFAFVANEIARHCKRPGSPIDDKMDVCHYNSKRQRFM